MGVRGTEVLTPFLALHFQVVEAFGRGNHHINMTGLLSQYVVPHILAFAKEAIRLHFIHGLGAVCDPFAVLVRFMVIRNLEMIERILYVVQLIICCLPLPLIWETDVVSA